MSESLFLRTFFGSDRRALITGSVMAGVVGLGLGLKAESASAVVQTEESTPSTPIYVNLPDWDCNQENLVGQADRGVIDYTMPDTSISDDLVVVTYPAIDQDENRFPQTVIYEDPGLQAGDTLRYYSNARECPLPDGAQTISQS